MTKIVFLSFCILNALLVYSGDCKSADKNEANIRQKRNRPFMKYEENKLSNFPNIAQEGKYWCGPAVLEAIFRYFGANSRDVFGSANTDTHFLWQYNLATLAQTGPTGTTGENLQRVLNDRNHLFGGHTYSIESICAADMDLEFFYRHVYYSLKNNIPVVMGYHGSSGPQSNNMPLASSPFDVPVSNDHSHFIVIFGISSHRRNPTSASEMTYIAMDPGNGREIRFSVDNLRYFFTRGRSYTCHGGYLIYYNPHVYDDDVVMEGQKRHINSYFPNLNLGKFQNRRADESSIRKQFISNNQHLPSELLNNIRVTQIANGRATISIDTVHYTGSTTVTFKESRSIN
ncbi:uncharacterized protein LOC116339247 [Contarinia nasturtii]|uniref:uncharacterized protein LOC116339247 n=1 Tax=Contarinia nasturtii TaxID=265458 RepID=UPI0012D46DFD|nr:uncharacterized protein LOC116339247 [Contarinia nasturtii]